MDFGRIKWQDSLCKRHNDEPEVSLSMTSRFLVVATKRTNVDESFDSRNEKLSWPEIDCRSGLPAKRRCASGSWNRNPNLLRVNALPFLRIDCRRDVKVLMACGHLKVREFCIWI